MPVSGYIFIFVYRSCWEFILSG